MRWTRRAAVAVLMTAMAVPALGTPAAAAAPGALFGLYHEPRTGWTMAEVKASILDMEASLGRPLGIDQHFYRWNLAFPSWKEPWDAANGRQTLISWGNISTTEINAGLHDPWIEARADATSAYGGPLLLRWFAEMDADALADRAVSPSEYIAAWKRIHGIFTARGATNVEWVWCPTAWGFDTGEAPTYYPGDGYVDWICADGYNWAPKRPGATWQSFASVFAKFYAWAAPRGKPLMVGETGTEERADGEKAAWLSGAATTMKTKYTAIKAFVYFDALEPEFTGVEYDWRIDSSASSLEAARAMVADPYFGGDTPPPNEPEPEPSTAQVTLETTGKGEGSIASPDLAPCIGSCTVTVQAGSERTFTAVAGSGSYFAGWSGACTGTVPGCTLTPQGPTKLSAAFGKIAPSKPDASVRRRGGKVSGAGVIDPTGQQDPVTVRVRSGRPRTVELVILNASAKRDSYTLSATTSGPGRVRFLSDAQDVTAQMGSGDLLLSQVPTGEARSIQIKVRIAKTTKIRLRVVSVSDPNAADALTIRLLPRRTKG